MSCSMAFLANCNTCMNNHCSSLCRLKTPTLVAEMLEAAHQQAGLAGRTGEGKAAAWHSPHHVSLPGTPPPPTQPPLQSTETFLWLQLILDQVLYHWVNLSVFFWSGFCLCRKMITINLNSGGKNNKQHARCSRPVRLRATGSCLPWHHRH